MKQSIHIIWIVFFISILISGNKAFAKTAENSDFLIVDGVLSKYIGEVNVNKMLEIPEGVKSIGEKAFNTEAWDVSKEGCLTLCIPRNVKICAGAFISCVPMNITFEEGRLEIEDGAFQYAGYFNEGKMTVTLPSSIKIIGERAFYNGFLGEPIKLNLNKGLVVVEDYALSGTKCHLPSTVKYLGEGALSEGWCDTEYSSTRTINLPEKLEVIGDYCFYSEVNCGLIKIPDSVKRIGEGAFRFCYDTYTTGFVVEKGNKYFKNDKNHWLYSKDGKRLLYALSYTGNITIPEGVEYCGAASIHNSPTSDTSARVTYFPSSLKKLHQDALCNYNECSAYFKGAAPDVIATEDNTVDSTEAGTEESMEDGFIPVLGISNYYVPKGMKQGYIVKLKASAENKDCIQEYN